MPLLSLVGDPHYQPPHPGWRANGTPIRQYTIITGLLVRISNSVPSGHKSHYIPSDYYLNLSHSIHSVIPINEGSFWCLFWHRAPGLEGPEALEREREREIYRTPL